MKKPGRSRVSSFRRSALQGLLPVGNGHAACGLSASSPVRQVPQPGQAWPVPSWRQPSSQAPSWQRPSSQAPSSQRPSWRRLLGRQPSSQAPSSRPSWRRLLGGAFLAGAFLAAAFLAGAFFAAAFLAGAAFFAGAFLAGGLLRRRPSWPELSSQLPLRFSLIKLTKAPCCSDAVDSAAIHRPESAQEGRPGTMNRVATRCAPLLCRRITLRES